MATHHIEATFLGEGPVFQHNHSYQLEVQQHWRGKLVVQATHGYDHKPVGGFTATYTDLGQFLRDWRVLRVVTLGAS